MIELLLAIAVRPPEPRICHLSCGNSRGGEPTLVLPGATGRLADRDISNCAVTATSTGAMCELSTGTVIETSALSVCGSGRRRDHLRIEMRTRPVARAPRPARCRYCGRECRGSSPSLRGDEGRPIERHPSAVLAGPAVDRLLVRDAGMRRRRDAHGDDVALPGFTVPVTSNGRG